MADARPLTEAELAELCRVFAGGEYVTIVLPRGPEAARAPDDRCPMCGARRVVPNEGPCESGP